MRKIFFVLTGLVVASLAQAQNVPSGLTGLWRFQNSADKLKATIGTDLVNSHPDNAGWLVGPWTVMNPGLSDNGIVLDRSNDYLTAYHGIGGPNGGGLYINEYTIAVDYHADPGWSSLYQTSWNGNANDGDLWIDAANQAAAKIGVGAVGYSAMTFDATKWHRIVWSVDNGNFFKVYVDGTLFLNGAGQAIDGRFSLELDRFHFFADNNWEDAWGRCGTAMVWGRALSDSEVAGMGGWIGGSAEPTPLTIPEPTALSLAVLGLACLLKRNRK